MTQATNHHTATMTTSELISRLYGITSYASDVKMDAAATRELFRWTDSVSDERRRAMVQEASAYVTNIRKALAIAETFAVSLQREIDAELAR